MSKHKKHIDKHVLLVLFLMLATIGWGQKLNTDELFAEARKAALEENFAKAADYCEKALEKNPLNMDVKELLGKCYMELGRTQDARITLLQVLEVSPKRVDARHYLLNIETKSERYSSAVCYANELLEITPYSKTLWMKKVGLYRLMNNDVEANRAIKRLYHIFPEDNEVNDMYRNSLKESALNLSKKQDNLAVVKKYEEVLNLNNLDAETYLKLINIQIKLGNYNAALQAAEKGSYYLPNNKEIFIKKIGVLELQYEYQKAIDLIRKEQKRAPSANLTRLENYLLSESARYFKNSDAFELYSQIYSMDKNNIEAFNYLLSSSLSRGYWGSASELLAEGLKRNPNSKELLMKKLFLYEMQQNEEGEVALTEKLYKLYPTDAGIKEKYDNQAFKQAKIDLEKKNYKAAGETFIRLKDDPRLGAFASNRLIDVYAAQGLFEKAHFLADQLIEKDGEDVSLKIKKVNLYTLDNKYEKAYDYLQELKIIHPENSQIEWIEIDFLLNYNKYLIENENYKAAETISNEILQTDESNKQAHLYKINAQLSMRAYDNASKSIQVALKYYPDDRDLKLKLADVYLNSYQIDKSIEILSELTTKYIYNQTIKNSLIESLFKKAKKHEQQRELEEAKSVYYRILELEPNDTLSVIKITNILIDQDRLQDAEYLINQSLERHKAHNEMLFLKGMIALRKEDYATALVYLTLYIPPLHRASAHRDLIDFIKSKLLKNEIAISYLRVRSDSLFLTASIATFEYVRIEKRNTFVGRINYAPRPTAIALQFEVDWYHTFKNKSNFLVNAAVANEFFKPFKLGVSYYQPFKKQYQAELGLRYINQRNNNDLFAGIVGIERYIDRFWVNLRATAMTDLQDVYGSLFAQSRFSLKNDRSYIAMMASIGSIPEDQKLDFQLNTFTSFTTTMVGAGYFHSFKYNVTAGIQGNWYTFRVSTQRYVNQYNLFLTVRFKF
jgi:YaiO family outer membrane protein